MTVVVAAGNDGDLGEAVQPTLSSIDSPGTAPSAISVGASTNAHIWVNRVRVTGNSVPASIEQIDADFGDGPLPPVPVTAPLRDILAVTSDGMGCTAAPSGSLEGVIVLVQRGTCTFAMKVMNAENAGALGVLIFQNNANPIQPPGGLIDTRIPAVLVSQSDGRQLRSLLASGAQITAAIDPTLVAEETRTVNQASFFSSRGPAIGTAAIKPEITAVGTDLYMAAESYDPNGELYSADGFTVAQGTSFSTPMVAGGVALVKQANPSYTPGQLKSAVVNTATQDLTDESGLGRVVAVGNGKMETASAIAATVTVSPATLSFGILSAGVQSRTIPLRVTNTGAASLNLSIAIVPRDADNNARVIADMGRISLGPRESAVVTFALAGSLPQPGSYEGGVLITGGPTRLRVPYLYLVGDGVPQNIVPLLGFGFDGPVGQVTPDGGIGFKVIDRYGVPVAGLAARFRVSQGGGQVRDADPVTNSDGVATAIAILGDTPGDQQFVGSAGGLSAPFDGIARALPAINANGVVNAATFQAGQAVAPGSYISIFGTALSDAARTTRIALLPLSLNGVSVGFDVPGTGVSAPGRLYYVSPRQVNVQVPWELRGQSSALVKVAIGAAASNLYTLPLADYSPGIFAITGENNAVVATGNPARRGHVIQIFANGLGPVDNQPPTGEPAPAQPLAHTLAMPMVTVGGVPAAVQFSGLAPGFSGLYQLNVTVPADVAPGVYPVRSAACFRTR
jgi:uncharacterized protein (TIGR03437 family)